MKKLFITSVLVFACGLSGFSASAQSDLSKIVGKWVLKLDTAGQEMEAVFDVSKTGDGVFAVLDLNDGQEPQKLEIKEQDGKLFSYVEIPEYGVAADVNYSFIDDDTVNVTIDTGSFLMESPLTRVKE